MPRNMAVRHHGTGPLRRLQPVPSTTVYHRYITHVAAVPWSPSMIQPRLGENTEERGNTKSLAEVQV